MSNTDDNEYTIIKDRQILWENKVLRLYDSKKKYIKEYEGKVSLDDLIVPLSFQELQIYRAEQTTQIGFHIHGSLNIKILSRSLDSIVMRHETLRTVYVEKNGKTSRKLVDSKWFKMRKIDLLAKERSDQEVFLKEQEKIDNEAILSFKTPLFRVTLVKFSVSHHVLLLSGHHMIFDAWAWGVLINEVSALYGTYLTEAPVPLSPIKIQYSEYVLRQQRWYQSREYEKISQYWCRRLYNLPKVIDFPTAKSRSVDAGYVVGYVQIELSSQLIDKIQKLIRRDSSTLFVLMLTVVTILLARYSGQSDIAITCPNAGRLKLDYESIIGDFASALISRNKINFNSSFYEIMKQVKENVLDDCGHMPMPFVLLKDLLRKHSGCEYKNLRQVAINVAPAVKMLDFPGVKIERNKSSTNLPDSNKRYPRPIDGNELSFVVRENVTLFYNSELYTEEIMIRFTDDMRCLLESVVEEAGRPLCDLSLFRDG
jgi:NRPS condensation-like uncharacterized protein